MLNEKKIIITRIAKCYAGKIKPDDLADNYEDWQLVLKYGNQPLKSLALNKMLELAESVSNPIACLYWPYIWSCHGYHGIPEEFSKIIRSKAEKIAQDRKQKEPWILEELKISMWQEEADAYQLIAEKKWSLVIGFYLKGNEKLDRVIEKSITNYITSSKRGFEILNVMNQHLVDHPYNGSKLQERAFLKTIEMTNNFDLLKYLLIHYVGDKNRKFGSFVLNKAFSKAKNNSDYIWILGHCGRIGDHFRCQPEEIKAVKVETMSKIYTFTKTFRDWLKIFYSGGHFHDDIFEFVFKNCLDSTKNSKNVMELFEYMELKGFERLSNRKGNALTQQMIKKMSEFESSKKPRP